MIQVIGQWFGTNGYVNHTKGLTLALNKLIDVKLSTYLFPNWQLNVNDEELKIINKLDNKDRINLIIDLPHNWNQYAFKKHNIGFLVWEGDKIPKSWIDCIIDKKINQVWVPSTHVYNAIKDTLYDSYDKQIIMDKVKIVPHGVDLDIFKAQNKENEILTFGCNKGFRGELDRGGLQHAIKAFIQEFNRNEAKLLIKINPAYAIPIEQLIILINKWSKELGKNMQDVPEIMINTNNLTQIELNNFYNSIDIFLNPTEGEAFSLPCIEAMACGKPVITTNFGGQVDYVTNSNGWLIDGNLHPVIHELIYEGINWMTIDNQKLREVMRNIKNQKELIREKGIKSIETAKNYTWDNSALKAIGFLNKLK